MEYGSAYLQPSRRVDEDAVSMLSDTQPRPQSQYRAYHPDHHRNSSSEESNPQRAPSWLVSPIDLQQSLPPEHPVGRPSPSPQLRPSIFGSGAVPEAPYQETVAWANSTQFRTASQEGPKPNTIATSFIVTEESLQQESRRYFRHPRHILEPWKTGFWMRFPWFGFGALFLILLLTGASAGILLGTNGMSPEAWKFGRDNAQPYVYISVFEMVMNFLILFALADGMVVRFWRQLLHGTTLSSMHDTYESAQLWPALKRAARLRFNTVAIACILSAMSFIRGPLFQRALTIVENGPESTQGTVDSPLYHTNPSLVVLGILLSLISISAILPLYNGFWELGRKVSLNPLEVARAFGAPLLDGLDGNATPDMITVERGGMGVRYGALERYGEGKKLRVEESARATVRVPWQGEIFA